MRRLDGCEQHHGGRDPDTSISGRRVVRGLTAAEGLGCLCRIGLGEDIESADADPELQRMFRQASSLDERERRILDDMMKSLLARRERDG